MKPIPINQFRRCPACCGDGQLCDICEQPPGRCNCEDNYDVLDGEWTGDGHGGPCDVCNGTGVVRADDDVEEGPL